MDHSWFQVLRRSIEVDASGNPFKYLNLAQILEGTEALQIYERGVTALTKLIETYPDDIEMKIQLSSALCAIAELYCTDLW